MSDEQVPESTRLARERTGLAFERTLLAHDRTLMAWIRTATSLISFGFTIYKFFDYMNDNRPPGTPAVVRIFGPREFAMTMIGAGLLALAIAVVEDRRQRRALAAAGAHVHRPLAWVLAAGVASIGIASFLLALFQR